MSGLEMANNDSADRQNQSAAERPSSMYITHSSTHPPRNPAANSHAPMQLAERSGVGKAMQNPVWKFQNVVLFRGCGWEASTGAAEARQGPGGNLGEPASGRRVRENGGPDSGLPPQKRSTAYV